ncbi:hypothetical protein Pint_13156 [Pistacia integerrima]|uniref:Uncharacterized protein n=1 Tax=Pistacia integerrima TaxID=434235 RepID=A0ACC0Y7U6_9ROSI|nr:hypothetical protein Pint_13156 [Pistacia integerrima]
MKSGMRSYAVPVIGFMFFALLQLGFGQSISPSPAPSRTSDGASIDQGIAYFLLMVALAVTYLVH